MHQDMYVKALALYLLILVTAAYQPLNFTEMKPAGGSFIAFPMDGDVYPSGCYTVTISIGKRNPPTRFVLDVDTGSDLTWVRCFGENVPPPYYNAQHEPGRINVYCGDPECKALGAYATSKCDNSEDACEYNINYADGGSSTGVVFKDSFHNLILSNGKTLTPQLAFGCGYPQDNEHEHSIHQNVKSGILGLGKGASGILKQLSGQGVIRDVVGHCLSSTGGGFIFLGNYDNIPSNMVWKTLVRRSQHYALGSADLVFDGKPVPSVRGLQIIFDSGSTYTYFNTHAYHAVAFLIHEKLQGIPGKPVNLYRSDNALPICWKAPQPFGSIRDAAKYFPNLALSFVGVPNTNFYFGPKQYLIISNLGNACLGILDGGAVGLGDMNVIGDISMQDKLVVYDNENARVGWAGVTSCSWT